MKLELEEFKKLNSDFYEDLETSTIYILDSGDLFCAPIIEGTIDLETLIHASEEQIERKDKAVARSLSRIFDHVNKYDTGMLTAFRNEFKRAENLKRNKKMLAQLLQLGYSVTKVSGVFVENFQSEFAKKVKENSFFVADYKNTGKLKQDLIALGEEFDQDCILFVPKGGEGATLHGTSKRPDAYPKYGQVEKLGRIQVGDESEFFSKVGNRPFNFTNYEPPFSNAGRYLISRDSKIELEEEE